MCKKMVYLSSFVLVLGLFLTSAAEAGDPNLVGYWQLDEGTGTIAMDLSGNGNDGTLVGGPQWVAGRIGGALQFDGSDDYVDCGNNPSLNITDAITVALWLNRTATPSPSYCIVSKGGGWTTHGYTFWQRASVIRPELQGPNAKVSTDATILPEDKWHHVAFTWEDTTDTVMIYIDGVLASTGTFAGPIGTSSENLRLGDYSGTQTRYYLGMMDDVQIYNRALTQEEIRQVMIGIPLGVASNPSPPNEATDVPRGVVLSWTPGEFANQHDVYFGTTFDDVNNATNLDPMGPDNIYGARQGADSYAVPERLDFGQTYYWRIDEVNAPPTSHVVFKGSVWSFTVEPVGYPLSSENIVAAASSSFSAAEGPENTVNGSGLDADDHSLNRIYAHVA